MRYKMLGNTGLRVSELCLGTMTFGEEWGWGSTKEESRKIFDAFAEAGGNFFAGLVAKAHTQLGFTGSAGVQVGEFSALPHGSVTPQTIREGTILLIDGGCKVEGYSSDISRTFVLGKATDKMKSVFELERRAQTAALQRPGPA